MGQTTTENFVKTTKYKTPTTTSITTPLPSQAMQEIAYLDGLGRPIQQVANQQSNTGKDIVLPIAYDAFGRQEKQYLPYIRTTASLDYDSSAITNVSTFYSNPNLSNTGNPNFEATTNPYTQTLFEASPLSRVLESANPGNDWEISNHHTVRMEYLFNIVSDNVKMYKVSASWNPSSGLYDIPLTDSGFYTANKLYKNVVKNENWKTGDGDTNTTQEFRNNQGQVILKRIFGESIINGTLNIVAHDTYYVYDQFGNLTYTIPPLVDTNSTITQTILNNLCYQYKYDKRNRLVEKKLPEKQWEFIVYDKLNRVVATGPTFAPFTNLQTIPPAAPIVGWLVTKYDALSRTIITGWMQSTSANTAATSVGRKIIQDARDADTILSENKQTATSTVNGVAFNYSNAAFPTGTTTYHLLTINYYDNYTTNLTSTFSPAISYTPSASLPIYYNNTTGSLPVGLPTISWVRFLETSTLYKAERTYVLYDKKARPIKTFTSNFLGGFTQIESQLEEMTGRVNTTTTSHKRLATHNALVVRDNYTYSNQDRLVSHTQTITKPDGVVLPTELIADNTYDELGRLIAKKVGNTVSNPLQKVDYSYNIRGWLKEINKIGGDPAINSTPLNVPGDPNDLFAFKINYQDNNQNATYPGENLVEPLYNGNISETFWRTSSDNKMRKYGYTYDKLNRLRNAVYELPYTTSPVSNMYNESMSYDKNGNIMGLQRNGDYDAQNTLPIPIDALEYSYYPSSNRLQWVKETSNNNGTLGFKDGIYTNSNTVAIPDYSYDLNGNMITDRNKGINTTSTNPIKYNHLNLPTEIVFATTPSVKKINYFYNAQGEKIQKIVSIGTNITTTDYLGRFQYLKAGTTAAVVMQYFPHAEGYVNFDSGVYKYVYNYTDHLGNIRVSYTKNNTTGLAVILEQNHYYPFGLKHTNYNATTLKLRGGNIEPVLANPYKYKYNGKELQDELGLNMTSMDFRLYDNAIGRFNVVDPLAEIDHNMSPYVFSRNNPVFFNDPTGLNSDYEDGDDTDWNAGLVGVDDTVKPPGFGGGLVSQSDMTSGDPMGGELREAVVSNNYKEGYDIHGRIDDEWEGTYFDRDNYGRGANPYSPSTDWRYSLAICAAPAVVVLAEVGAIGAAATYLYTSATAALSQITLSSATIGVTTNTFSQYLANQGNIGKINWIEAGSSMVPGIGPVVFGETFSYSTSNGFQTPNSFAQWSVQVGGGILSNSFGKATDNYLGNNISNQVVGEYFKFQVETATNIAPTIIK